MVININGVIINGINIVENSTVYPNATAIQDIDGAWIHIPNNQLEILLSRYTNLRNRNVKSTQVHFADLKNINADNLQLSPLSSNKDNK
jgi:hypothetical protein